MDTQVSVNQPGRTAWKAFAYFNLYRFLIAFLFVSLHWLGQLPQPLGVYDRSLFAASANMYLVACITAHFFIHIQKPRHAIQVAANVSLDIIFITFMMYASAGLNSGFGMLIVISVAAGGILKPGKISILFAAIATIAVLGHETYIQFYRTDQFSNYTHAGLLGITFFVTASISQILSTRAQESEALAQQRALDLENLAQLNEYIVQRLQPGVVVLDDELRIRLLNESAKNMLGIDKDVKGFHIDDVVPELAKNARMWKKGLGERSSVVRSIRGGMDVQASFVPLNLEKRLEILIFLDDVSVLQQRAQQMKLASLGRLTASIAHEIRNPLGAISHAGQLLSESNALGKEDKRLTTIIEQHSQRVNNIVENIMGLSRREQAEPVIIELGSWLVSFIEEYLAEHNLQAGDISLNRQAKAITARMDPSQLHQVLCNILENSVRYSKGSPLIEIKYAITGETQRPYIDIIDHGTGISDSVVEHLFEPFFTTSSQGAGLGLYISRELCEANQATLNLYNNTKEGCCFRVNFSHPEKQHSLV